MTTKLPLLPVLVGASLVSAAALAQTTVFHFRVNDTDAGGLPTVPSVGGSPGVAQGTFTNLLSTDVPTDGVPAGAGNRSLVGAADAGSDGVNSAGTQELLNATIVANGGFTYECWFKWFGGGTVNSIIDYAGTEKLRIHTGLAGDLDMNWDQGTGAVVLQVAPTPNEWHYVALVFEYDGLGVQPDGGIGGTMTWYYDSNEPAGTMVVDKDDFGDSLNRAIGVGKHPISTFVNDDFNGLVYEPRVTLGALSADELLFTVAPDSDPQLVAPDTFAGQSDGNAIQLDIPVENFRGTTLGLNLTSVDVSGPDAADFAVSSFDTPIAADGGIGSIVVDFTPSAGDGIYEATLTINSNDPMNPAFDVALSVDVRDPAIVVAPVLDFGIFTAAPDSFTEFLDVENLGGLTTLELSNPQIAGAGSAAYQLTTLPDTIAPGGLDILEVAFDPGMGGDFPAQLTIETNDPRNPVVTIELRAQVFDPSILIDPFLNFGPFPADPGPQSAEVFLDNFGDATDLVVSNPQFSGPAAAFYTVTRLPASIPPGGFDTLEVTFDPGASAGAFPALLILETNDPFFPTVTVPITAFVEGPIDLEGPSKLSHWTFDDPANLGDDIGSLDYDGTINGDVQPSDLAAVGSGAVQFDGNQDYILIPQGGLLYANFANDGDGVTVATWVCSSSGVSLSARQRYFTKDLSTGGGGFGVGQNDATNQLIATTYGVFDYFGATLPVQDEWHHVAYVFRGSPPSSVDYYMDGALAATTAGTVGVGAGPGDYAIGGFSGSEWFDGLLDDLRVYAVELDASQVAELAAMGTPGAKVPTSEIAITSVGLVTPTRLRIEFVGAADTLHEVYSSTDLVTSPFTGAVTVASDGLTTDATGAGFVEIDLAGPGPLFFQIQEP